jgi:nitronate monooxygenase
MKLPSLKIGDLVSKLPIIQGGMGVGVSGYKLASAVANEGGVGVISGVQIGYREPDFEIDTLNANVRAMKSEIRKAKELRPKGIIGVNLMVAITP